jgi:hypothetical protein
VLIKLITLFILLFSSFAFIYYKSIRHLLTTFTHEDKRAAIALLTLSALMFIPIRGGFTVSTMNVGKVYFHKTNNFANHAGINVLWNFLYSV